MGQHDPEMRSLTQKWPSLTHKWVRLCGTPGSTLSQEDVNALLLFVDAASYLEVKVTLVSCMAYISLRLHFIFIEHFVHLLLIIFFFKCDNENGYENV